MATIYREFIVQASPAFVWEALKDVGAVHTRLAKGFVASTTFDGSSRVVTFANGFSVRENIVSLDDSQRRLAYNAVGGRTSHHNASYQVFEGGSAGESRVVWISDFLPDNVAGLVEPMVVAGITAIQKTLAESYPAR